MGRLDASRDCRGVGWPVDARNITETNGVFLEHHHLLGGGFKYLLSSPLPGEAFQFD